MKKDITIFNLDTKIDNTTLQDYILSPDEDLAKAITFDELLEGVKNDLKKIYLKRKLYHS